MEKIDEEKLDRLVEKLFIAKDLLSEKVFKAVVKTYIKTFMYPDITPLYNEDGSLK